MLQAQDTIKVIPGWNMIGAISTISLSEIRSDPTGIITSSYYGYSPGGYSSKDTLKKGFGYWVKSTQTGIIITESANRPPAIPFNPLPNHSATDVSTSPTLLWNCTDPDDDLLTYDIYLGTDNPPATKISSAQSNSYLSRSGLTPNEWYNWRVVAKDSHNDSSTSPVWQFMTLYPLNHSPDIPYNPLPINNDTGLSATIELNWECSDPDNDLIVYDTYFGTDNPPTTLVSSISGTHLSLGLYDINTTYFWKVVAKDVHGGQTPGPVWSFTTTSVFSCTNRITYAGKSYNTVPIGSQCWLRENLNVGTMITGVTNQTDNSTLEKYCYNNTPSNCDTYGALYQWDEAMQYSISEGTQGICPTGWHIPTFAEMQTLKTTVNNDGNALKAIGQGIFDGAGTNTSGFSALLSGCRTPGDFAQLTTLGFFWNSTVFDVTNARELRLEDIFNQISLDYREKNYGFSIRCLKN